MTRRRITAVAVGIPARNEAETIERCLRSIAGAAAACDLPVVVVVAADSCVDDTHHRAALAFGEISGLDGHAALALGCGSAGGARDAACRSALDVVGAPPEHVWVATTDADSVVPPDWLRRQLAWAAAGADGVAGQVRLDRSTPFVLRARARRHLARLGTGYGHPHVHGANLGVRADRWLQAGGFAHVTVGEDQALWRVLRGNGAHLVAAPDGIVTTSGRLVGRAPDGFAAVLAGLVG